MKIDLLVILILICVAIATFNGFIWGRRQHKPLNATLYVNGCVWKTYHAETTKDSLVIKNIGWISPSEIDSIVVTRGGNNVK